MPSVEMKGALNCVLGNQNPRNHGFSTFGADQTSGGVRHPKPVTERSHKMHEGWYSPEPYVTAVAAIFLNMIDKTSYRERITNALGFLEREQTEWGCWNSYWFNGQTLPTEFCIRALLIENGRTRCVSKALDWILKSQQPSGGWMSKALGQTMPLETSFALLCLLDMVSDNAYDELSKGVDYLLANHESDGSWRGFPCMSVPMPNEIKNFRDTNYTHPELVLLDDNRVFTTANVTNFMVKYCSSTCQMK